METITIEVTQDDIDNGKPDRIDMCPIVLACRRAIPGRTSYVGECGDFITVYGGIGVIKYSLSKEAMKFINDFDYRNPVKPFTFVAERK